MKARVHPVLPLARSAPPGNEVKYKKGHKYLTVVCDHTTGRVIWAAKGRSKDTVHEFFDALGDRAARLQFVTADGATWITNVIAERAPTRSSAWTRSM
jgi:transposase